MSDIESWFKSLPPFTKIYLCASSITTLLVSIGIVSPYSVYYDSSLVFSNLQIWRLLTTFTFFGTFSFQFLISMVILVRFTRALETHPSFMNDFAGFMWAVSFMAAVMLLLSYIVTMPFLGSGLVFGLLYVWSKKDSDAAVPFWGGFMVKGYQFPFVLMAFRILLGGNVIDDLMGLLAGHLYYTLKEIVPHDYGYDLLKTPFFMRSLFPEQTRNRAQHNAFAGRGYRLD
jgi:hypothetical protein